MNPYGEESFPFYINSGVWLGDPFIRGELSTSERGVLMTLIAFASICNDRVFIPSSAPSEEVVVRDKCLKQGLLVGLKQKDWYMFTRRDVLYKHGEEGR